MKCVILASDKMSQVPIAECGGALLTEDCRLVVKEELAARMLLQYGPRLVKAGECERESLRGGHYQVEGGKSSYNPPLGKSEDKPKKKEEPKKEKAKEKVEKKQPEESPLEEVSSDKSMHKSGKKKYRRK